MLTTIRGEATQVRSDMDGQAPEEFVAFTAKQCEPLLQAGALSVSQKDNPPFMGMLSDTPSEVAVTLFSNRRAVERFFQQHPTLFREVDEPFDVYVWEPFAVPYLFDVARSEDVDVTVQLGTGMPEFVDTGTVLRLFAEQDMPVLEPPEREGPFPLPEAILAASMPPGTTSTQFTERWSAQPDDDVV